MAVAWFVKGVILCHALASLPLCLRMRKSSTYRGRRASIRHRIATLTPNEFPDVQTVEKRLLDFQAYYETLARPFEWKFTRADLDELLVKLAGHEQNQNKTVA